MSASEPVLRIDRLSKSYGPRVLLRSVSMSLAPGERLVLLGESGSGKSSLLNLIAGLEPADSGEIRIAGQAIDTRDSDHNASIRREKLGFVFQAFHLVPHLDAVSNVMLPLLLKRMPYRSARQHAMHMLARLGLEDFAAAMPASLSGGEQQRVAIARALIHDPVLILADEPTGNLDADNAERVLDLLRSQCEARQATLLMVTHSSRAARIATRQLRLSEARLIPAC